jgi:hypothetical protein
VTDDDLRAAEQLCRRLGPANCWTGSAGTLASFALQLIREHRKNRMDTETTPAEALLLKTLDVIRDRRPKYGGPRQHFKRTVGMINAAFGEILRRPLTEADWAVIMTLDKVARYMGPNKTEDGPIDLAGYAACLAECEAPDGEALRGPAAG